MGFFKPNIKKMLNRQDIEGLQAALNHKDEGVRADAAEALGDIGDAKAVEALIQALQDEVYSVVCESAVALGKIKDPRAGTPLIEALKEDRPLFGIGAMRALAGVIWALGELKDTRALKRLLKATKKDKEEDEVIARQAMLFSLAEKNETRLARLLEARREEFTEVRKQAAIALGKIGDKRAVDRLIEVLKDEDLVVRAAAVKALEEIGDAKAVGPLLQSLRDYWELAEAPEETAKFVYQSLQVLRNGDLAIFLPEEVAEALSNMGEEAAGPLVKALEDKNKYVREAAKTALEKIRAKKG